MRLLALMFGVSLLILLNGCRASHVPPLKPIRESSVDATGKWLARNGALYNSQSNRDPNLSEVQQQLFALDIERFLELRAGHARSGWGLSVRVRQVLKLTGDTLVVLYERYSENNSDKEFNGYFVSVIRVVLPTESVSTRTASRPSQQPPHKYEVLGTKDLVGVGDVDSPTYYHTKDGIVLEFATDEPQVGVVAYSNLLCQPDGAIKTVREFESESSVRDTREPSWSWTDTN